jgi:ATP-dependent RNA helicase DeaD
MERKAACGKHAGKRHMKFTELGLSSGVLSSIGKLGFETPTPIQAEAIPFLLQEEQDRRPEVLPFGRVNKQGE